MSGIFPRIILAHVSRFSMGFRISSRPCLQNKVILSAPILVICLGVKVTRPLDKFEMVTVCLCIYGNKILFLKFQNLRINHSCYKTLNIPDMVNIIPLKVQRLRVQKYKKKINSDWIVHDSKLNKIHNFKRHLI